MKNLKIAYLNWGGSHAQHRRFAKFSSLENLNAEVFDPNKQYDALVLNQNSDLSFWSRYPKNNLKLIFDFTDSYLDIEPYGFRRNLRGLAKYITGQHRFLEFFYHQSLEKMMQRADAVVCSTLEQKKAYLKYNQNVHAVLDINENQIRSIKSNYEVKDRIHFVWEGMGGNAWAFGEILPVLQEIASQRPIALHLVTDLECRAYNGPLSWQYSVKRQLKSILGDIPFYLYEWNPTMLSQICSACDIALLPIPRKPAIYWGKPENRLLMLWRMGLPVLASGMPAHARCMKNAGVVGSCDNLQDWRENLNHLLSSEEARKQNAQKGLSYANELVSYEAIRKKWYDVLESVL